MKGLSYCMWFDSEAEQAARFYTSVFKNSKMGDVVKYMGVGEEIHGQPAGKVMTAQFEIEGAKFMALNGGPLFTPNESFSVIVNCDTQEEIDHYWNSFLENGGTPSQCGWLKDKWGFSWQISPAILGVMMTDPDKKKVERVVAAFMQMKKYDIAELKRAFEGK